jgi:uncharacterized protein (TIGR04255 family)
MKIPESERVIYKYNPLIEVVCQLRFPTILRIAHQQPVDFQDNIRFEYPIFEVSQNFQLPPDFSNIIQQVGSPLINEPTYIFKSEDLNWQLSINKESITLVTTNYERYEQFSSRFKKAVEVFANIYNPSFYSRIGLRYRDLIVRSKLNIQDKEWSKLISEHLASELHNPAIADSITVFMKNLQLDTGLGQVAFNHGIVKVRDTEKGIDESAYLLDADFFTERKIGESQDVWNILNQFNHSARNLFRWSITSDLHAAMHPQPLNVNTN